MSMDSLIYKNIHALKEKIYNINDLKILSSELIELREKLQFFHAKVFNDLSYKNEINLIGFHGQTLYHNSREKVSKQLGDGKLLNQLTKKRWFLILEIMIF